MRLSSSTCRLQTAFHFVKARLQKYLFSSQDNTNGLGTYETSCFSYFCIVSSSLNFTSATRLVQCINVSFMTRYNKI